MDYAGLLGQFQPNEEDRRKAIQMGLLQAGLGILAGNQQRNLGPALGAGGLAGMQAYNQALQQGPQQRMAQIPVAMKLAELQQDAARRAALGRVMPNQGGMLQTGGQPARFDRAAASEYLSLGGDPAKLKALRDLDEEQKPMTLAPGATVYDPRQGRAVFTAPNKPDQSSLAALLAEYQVLPANDPRRSFYEDAIRKSTTHAPPIRVENYPAPIAVIDPRTGQPTMVQFTNAGRAVDTGFRPIAEAKPPTEGERVAGGYADRMIGAESIIERVGAEGYPSLTTDVAGKVPVVGRYAQTKAMTPDQQMVRQAQEDWVRAKLRKESGAVIGKDEMQAEIDTYFPRPGDLPQTIAQKAAARQTATRAMTTQAGKAAPQGQQADPVVIDFSKLKRNR